MTFALATVPIIGFVGAAVDYSRGNSAKVAMQMAIDSTALMLSKDAPTLTTAEQLSQKANDYFGALFNRTEVTNIVVTPTFTIPELGSFKLEVSVTGKVSGDIHEDIRTDQYEPERELRGALGNRRSSSWRSRSTTPVRCRPAAR